MSVNPGPVGTFLISESPSGTFANRYALDHQTEWNREPFASGLRWRCKQSSAKITRILITLPLPDAWIV